MKKSTVIIFLKKNILAVISVIMIIATIITVAVITVSRKNEAEETAQMKNITDWGLSFSKIKNKVPTGNVSQEELDKYNAHFIDDSGEKVIYLTFDSGYENGYTAEILDILKEENVPAAFFLVGNYFKTQPELVKRMTDEGHIVGNHTTTHPDMSQISDFGNFRAEIEQVEVLYYDIMHKDLPKFYRPPQGKFSISNLLHAQKLGYKTVFWSLAYEDWDNSNQPSPEYALEKLNSRIHNGAIVLLHSTSKTNAAILRQLIKDWKEQGYVFKSLNDLK